MIKVLWILLILGQIISAGNMNYQQESGYYEVNPAYGKHPSKERVYLTKAVEVTGLYVLTKTCPKYEKKLLIGTNIICWGFIISDREKGIAFEFKW